MAANRLSKRWCRNCCKRLKDKNVRLSKEYSWMAGESTESVERKYVGPEGGTGMTSETGNRREPRERGSADTIADGTGVMAEELADRPCMERAGRSTGQRRRGNEG
jgi:hypothetical protein